MRLTGWWHFFSVFAARSQDAFTCAIATSAATASAGSEAFSDIYHLDPIAFLARHDFDRIAYSRDICRGGAFGNRAITERLEEIKDVFDPDIVISCTDNKYLKRVFGATRTMFMELGPMPRLGMKAAIYVDPYGHQVNSALDWFGTSRWSHPALPEFDAIWRSTWRANVERKGRADGIVDWLTQVRGEKPVLLLALQPQDWLTYEGIGPDLDPVSLLRRTAFHAGNEWMVVPQWHGADQAPSEALVADIMDSQPNIQIPPVQWRIAQSELLLPHVDRVTTISSNVAVAGAILGKAVSALGQAKFQALTRAPPTPRIDVLAFLTSRYCLLLDDFLDRDGAFAEHVLRLSREPAWLFDERGIDPERIYAFLDENS